MNVSRLKCYTHIQSYALSIFLNGVQGESKVLASCHILKLMKSWLFNKQKKYERADKFWTWHGVL